MQFVPEDSVYTYFRYDGKKTVMVIINANDSEKNIKMERFQNESKAKAMQLMWLKKEYFTWNNATKSLGSEDFGVLIP